MCIFACDMQKQMSKLLGFFLGFYCLFLAVLPCHCSEPEAGMHAHITTSVQQDGPHHAMDSKLCTPFCICSGVHNPNFFVKNAPLVVAVTPVLDYYSPYIESVCHYHRIDIWRPPKEYILL